MKILKKVIISIVLFILGGCVNDRHFIHDRSRYDPNCNSQVFSNNHRDEKESLRNEKHLNKSGRKQSEHDISLNRSKHLKIETYIPFPGKNEKKNSLLAEEYLYESDGEYSENNTRLGKYRESEIYIPFPKGYRKKRLFFTEEYLNEDYLEEPGNGYSSHDTSFIQSQDRQPQVYQPTPSKHQKPQNYIPTPSGHQNPQASIPTTSKHHKPQTNTPTPSKHQKPHVSISKPSKHRKP